MVNNKKHEELIKNIAKDINGKKDITYIEAMLGLIYETGIKEGKNLVIKNAIDYINQ